MATLSPSPKFQVLDNNGDPLVNGHVYTYEPGTVIDKPTYTDSTEGTANANPVILNARGEADIWWVGEYKVVITDADDVPLPYSVDNYNAEDRRNLPAAITHNIATDADYTLTATQETYGRIIITDTGVTLTTARNIICSTTERGYYFQNDTAQILTFKTSAGTGIALAAGERVFLLCDGTNVVRSLDVLIPISEGGTGQITAQAAIDALTQVSGATANQILEKDGSGNTTWTKVAQANIDTTSLNPIIQIQRTDDGTVATGTTLIPLDDTIPQITEGDEYMTVSITPKDAGNILYVEALLFLSHSTTSALTPHAALFKDSTANALAAASSAKDASTTVPGQVKVSCKITAGGTSAITFRVRAGHHSAGTTTFNGSGGVRYFGGVMSSYIQVTEVAQ